MGNPVNRDSMREREIIYRFLVLRMIVATFVVGAGMMIIQVTNESFPVRPLYLLLALSTLSGGAAYLGFRFGLPHRLGLWTLMISDLFVEAAIIHYAGGVTGQFTLVYCLTIVAAAFLLEMSGGLVTAIIASTFFVLYGILETVGAVAPHAREMLSQPPRPLGLVQVYMHVLMFFLVGAVGGYLAHRIKQKGRQLESAENELEQLKFDTDYILNNMSSGILVVDADGTVVTMNPAAEDILGVDKEDVLLRHIDDSLHGTVPELTSELIDALHAEKSKYRYEITISTGGRQTPLGTSISLLRDPEGAKRGAISVFQDLTEVQEMRERIRKADRLAAIGELSAGIAHELRNPLASISGSIELLASELDLSGEHRRLMNLVMSESDRLDRIINDFLEFARLRPPRRRMISIIACLEEVLMLLKNNAVKTRGIDIEMECHVREVHVNVDDEQLRQVFTNLAVNSCDAMDGRGSLRIVAGQEEPGWVRITFFDEGPGIDDRDVDRLFEPFFTTKEAGTGLGLAIANRIVTAHGGVIEFRNRKDGGAEFTVVLPVGTEKSAAAAKTAAAGAHRSGTAESTVRAQDRRATAVT
jgi:two-component system sensor histidine kinase PilS (NtrC family)